MAGLGPAIHAFASSRATRRAWLDQGKVVDARAKPGHDGDIIGTGLTEA